MYTCIEAEFPESVTSQLHQNTLSRSLEKETKMMFSSVLRRSSRMMMRGSQKKCRYFSSEFDHETFVSDMLEQVKDVPTATDPFQSSEILRNLVKSNVLSYWDMKENPEKFFMAHRLLATVGLGGFGIRFTVQFNLFAGSIVGLAGPDQLGVLDDLQKSGELGCFLLTENQAGVLSGFIVETTAKWDPSTQEFVLNTPNDAAAKNWISQGYTAEHGVVIADLQVDGKSYGPHPFLMRLRDDDGNLCNGIRIDDMGDKTVANDLDNARVWFSNVKLPHGSLLNKFADIQDDKYVQVGDEPMRIEVIGQRLMTGRQAIAEAALVSARVLHMKTEEYAKTKICNGINGETTLLKMPQLKSVFDRSYRELDDTIAFVAGVENRLNDCLRNEKIPDEVFFSYTEKSSVVPLTGTAGTAAFVDPTRCYHYGSRMGTKPRWLLMLHYQSAFSSDLPVLGKRIRAPRLVSEVFDNDVSASVLGYTHQHIIEVKRARIAQKV